MYTILVTKNNDLVATQKSAIMQYSTMVDKLQFLVPPDYNDEDMSTYKVEIEYLSPISHIYRHEELIRSDELYKEHLQYILPVDTKITAETGEVELQLSFLKVELDADTGKPKEYVRKTQSIKLNIIPVANWSQYISDDALTSLDSRLLQMMALQNEITEIQSQIMEQQNKKE